MTAQALADLLHARRTGRGKWQGKCPAHRDRNPSLSISEGKDGRVLLNCHAGCATAEVLAAKGLNMADLYPSKQPAPTIPNGRPQTVHYPYLDANGNLLYRVTRFPDKQFRQSRPDGKGGWIWNLDGITRVPYCLPELLKADMVMIVEGEKDCDNLSGLHLERYEGAFKGRTIAATTNSGGAGKWNPTDGELFENKGAFVFEDNDPAGRKHVQDVLASVYPHAKSVKLIRLPGLPEHGDLSDWMQVHTVNELIEQMQNAPAWHLEPVATPFASEAKIGSSPVAHMDGGRVGILEAALEAVGHRDTVRETFCALCVVLQRLRGNESVVLPTEKIAAAIGCHWTLIARLRRQLVADGGLKPERAAIPHRQAARFFVLSDTPPLSGVVIENFLQPRIPSPFPFSDTHQSEGLSDTRLRPLSDTPGTGAGCYVEGEL